MGFSFKFFTFKNPISNIREHSTETKKPKTVIYGGRISKEKGVEEVIDSFLMSGLKDYDFEIYGDGPELEVLRKKYISVNRVKFKGFIENKKMIEKFDSEKQNLDKMRINAKRNTLKYSLFRHYLNLNKVLINEN